MRRDRLQCNDAILRKCSNLQLASADALGLNVETLIAEETRIQGVVAGQLEVQSSPKGILIDRVVRHEAGDVEIGIRRAARNDRGSWILEGIDDDCNRRNRL